MLTLPERADLFLDNNVLLHYRFFADVDWAAIAGAQEVRLCFAYTVIKKLDEQKYASADRRVQKRARKVLSKLQQLHESPDPELRPAVSVVFLATEPDLDFAKYSLRRDSDDDRLIAEIIKFQEGWSPESVFLVTDDFGLRVKSSNQGIRLIKMPESYRLPDPPDPKDQEIANLRRKLAELENRLPDLRVCFRDESDRATFSLRVPATISVAEKIEEKRKELAYMPPTRPTAQSDPLAHWRRLAEGQGPTPDEIETYKYRVEEYLENYGSYLKEMIEHDETQSRTIELTLALRNGGNAPADDIDVYLHFPDGFDVLGEDDLPKAPTPPKPPSKPTGKSLFDFPRFATLSDLHIPTVPQFDPTPPVVSGPRIKKTQSYDVHFHVQRVKHLVVQPLDPLFVVFPWRASARSFTVEYYLISASLPRPQDGRLHVIIIDGEI